MSWEPPPPPPPEEPAAKPRGRVRIVAIAAAIAITGAVAGFVMSRAGAITLASTTASTPTPKGAPAEHPPSFGRGGFGFPCGGGFASTGFGSAFGGFCGGETGTVTKVSGSTLTLRTLAGTVTVTTSSTTKYSREEQQVGLSAIEVGDVVVVRGSRTGTSKTATSPIAATAITIEVPSVSGRVQSVSGTTITLVTGNGQLEYITTSGATAYHGARGASASSTSVKTGLYIVAQGTQTDLTHLDADTIEVVGNFSFAPPNFPGHFGPRPSPSAAGKPA